MKTKWLLPALMLVLTLFGAAFAENMSVGKTGVVAITDFGDRDIPLYKKPGGKPFDILVIQRETFADGVFAIFYTLNDTLIFVRGLKDGWEIAEEIRNSDLQQAQSLRENPDYMLEFAAEVVSDGGWIKVVPYISESGGVINIDGATINGKFKPHAPLYIHYNPLCMRFIYLD